MSDVGSDTGGIVGKFRKRMHRLELMALEFTDLTITVEGLVMILKRKYPDDQDLEKIEAKLEKLTDAMIEMMQKDV